MSIAELETSRLILRGILSEDASAYQKYFADYEVIRHLSTAVPWPYPENGAAEFVKDFILPIQGKDRWIWGIFLKTNSQELIGGVDLWRKGIPEHRGFWLGKNFWGKGIMTEAVVPVNDYAFNELGFERLVFSNALGNTASRKIKEKTGALLIRTEPAKFIDPNYTEREIWELTKQRWNEYRNRSQP